MRKTDDIGGDMSLGRTVEIVLSIAACSGVVLVLSGTAYADENGADTTTQAAQVGKVQSETAIEVPVGSPEHEVVKTESTPEAKTTDPQTAAAAGQVKVDTTKTDVTAPVVSTGVSEKTAANQPEARTEAAGKGQADVIAPAPAVVTLNLPVPVSEPAGSAASSVAIEAPVVVTAALPIQPKITTIYPVNSQDLAASLPSAPDVSTQPTNVPDPLQPVGLFSRLTASLASSVVPSWIDIPASGALGSALTLTLTFIALCLMVGIAGSFGLWLRRGGYAHAARSDVANQFNSFFATSFRLGYVPATEPSHSPFLVVSEMKTAMDLFPTLIERRRLAC